MATEKKSDKIDRMLKAHFNLYNLLVMLLNENVVNMNMGQTPGITYIQRLYGMKWWEENSNDDNYYGQ